MGRAKTKPPWNCPLCRAPDNRSTHHIEPVRLRGNSRPDNLEDICRTCHDQVELWYETVIVHSFPEDYQRVQALRQYERTFNRLLHQLRKLSRDVDAGRLGGLEEQLLSTRRELRGALDGLDERCCRLDWQGIYSCVREAVSSGIYPGPNEISRRIEDYTHDIRQIALEAGTGSTSPDPGRISGPGPEAGPADQPDEV